MSESAVPVKLFLPFWGPNSCDAYPNSHTLLLTGAEDKALPGGNLSAGSGAKTMAGLGVQPSPTNQNQSTGIGINA